MRWIVNNIVIFLKMGMWGVIGDGEIWILEFKKFVFFIMYVILNIFVFFRFSYR